MSALAMAVESPIQMGASRAPVSDATYAKFAAFLKRSSGLAMSPEKKYLLQTRLDPLARLRKMVDLNALADAITDGRNPSLEREVVEAMTTNETLFFRDIKPFTALSRTLLPAIATRRTDKRLRVLCAAASTGQEPYSIAFSIRETGALFTGWNTEIVAGDIDSSVLKRAAAGTYSQFEVQRGLPAPLLVKYFTSGESGAWQVKDDVRRMIRWHELNLLGDLTRFGMFDIIFCRNVLLYFDVATKTAVLSRLLKQLVPGGHLFLGCAETIIGLTSDVKPLSLAGGLYEKPAGAV